MRTHAGLPCLRPEAASTQRDEGRSLMTVDVTVLMTAYQSAATIDAALTPLLHQDFGGTYEVLVVDDASTDATAERLRARSAADSRLRVITLPVNGGQTAALSNRHRADGS